jgi:hypothetical protein
MGWTTRVRFPAEHGFSLQHHAQTGSGEHKASDLMRTGVLYLGVKRPRRAADHSPPSSAEVKSAWSYTTVHLLPDTSTEHCAYKCTKTTKLSNFSSFSPDDGGSMFLRNTRFHLPEDQHRLNFSFSSSYHILFLGLNFCFLLQSSSRSSPLFFSSPSIFLFQLSLLPLIRDVILFQTKIVTEYKG